LHSLHHIFTPRLTGTPAWFRPAASNRYTGIERPVGQTPVKTMGLCRLSAAILGLAIATISVGADELTDFHAAIEQAASHNRVAIGYLGTENIDLAAFELDGLRQAWSAFAARFGKLPPAGLRDNPLFATTLADVPVRAVTASMMINMGRPDIARDSLLAIRNEISALRRASHIEVLADCVLDANTTMDALFIYHDNPPDWAKPGIDHEVAAKADAYAGVLQRCDSMAPPSVRASREFRRLVDGALASLALVPKAIEARDSDLLHRLLIELRSFDNLIAFRFG
jgi:hypothetical protein